MELTTILQVLYRFYRYYTDFEVIIFPATVSIKLVYFILSSEINVYPKQIKVILSTVKNVVFFTSDGFDIHVWFYRCTKPRLFRQFRASFLPEKIWNTPFLSDITLRTYTHQMKELTSGYQLYLHVHPKRALPSKINEK